MSPAYAGFFPLSHQPTAGAVGYTMQHYAPGYAGWAPASRTPAGNVETPEKALPFHWQAKMPGIRACFRLFQQTAKGAYGGRSGATTRTEFSLGGA
jgi:hypothetical protein